MSEVSIGGTVGSPHLVPGVRLAAVQSVVLLRTGRQAGAAAGSMRQPLTKVLLFTRSFSKVGCFVCCSLNEYFCVDFKILSSNSRFF